MSYTPVGHTRYSPVGYIYDSDAFCTDCTPGAVCAEWKSYRRGGSCNCAECLLDRIAEGDGIERRDEYTFDSGTFPKSIPYHNDLHSECGAEYSGDGLPHCYERCGNCHEVIDGPCSALETEAAKERITLQ